MMQNLNDLLREIKLQRRDIQPEELAFIFEKLLGEMAEGGFETEIALKLKFFFDEEGRPFIQATTPLFSSSTSIHVGNRFEYSFSEDNGQAYLMDESPFAVPVKHKTIPEITDTQRIALFNSLINFPVMLIIGLYDQIKYEYYKLELSDSKNKKERNEIRKKMQDRHENNLDRATLGKTNPDIGRPQKTSEQIESEKINFLQKLYSAFNKWRDAKSYKNDNRIVKIPKQTEICVHLTFSRANSTEKKLSEALKFYNFNFKELWNIFEDSKNADEFLKKIFITK